MSNTIYLNGIRVELALNRIYRDGETVKVEPKVMAVLVRLVKNEGDVVSREELMAAAWPDVIVGDESVTHAISDLRRALGDSRRNGRFIETIPKVGYRLIATVESGVSRKESSTVRTTTLRRVAAAVSLVGAVAAFLLVLPGLFVGQTPESIASVVPLTSFPGVEHAPALSPDGSRLAYSWSHDGSSNIYVMLEDGQRFLQLTNHPDTDANPAWSPDGSLLAFVRSSESDCSIQVIPALGGTPHRIATCEANSEPDVNWHPNGAKIGFTDRESSADPYSVQFVSVASGERLQVTFPDKDSEGDIAFAFSDDGQQISVVRTSAKALQDIFVIPVDRDRPKKRLTPYSWLISDVEWVPGADRMVFTSDEACVPGLWTIPVKGGFPTALSGAVGRGGHPSVSRNGQKLAYARWQVDTNIWEVSTSPGSAPHKLEASRSTRWDSSPQFSPDGQTVAFISGRSGHLELWVQEETGDQPRRVTDFGGPYVSTPRWSPDGKSIVLDSRRGGRAVVFAVDVATGTTVPIVEGEFNAVAPSWSRDGRSIYFGSDKSGSWQLWRSLVYGPSVGEPNQITQDGGITGLESEDGDLLYFTKKEVPGVWQMPVDGGAETLIVASVASEEWGSWGLTSEGLYYLDNDNPENPVVKIYRSREADTVVLSELPSNLLVGKPNVALSPDGVRLLFVRVDDYQSDLFLATSADDRRSVVG